MEGGHWHGEDRRQYSEELNRIWEVLRKLETAIDHYEKEREELRPKIDEVLDILTQSKGIFKAFRFLVYIVTPIGAALYWIKDHVKF